MSHKTAFVTGASRGIGKACAIHLAKAGFDVAITARTIHEGDAREHSPTVKRSDVSPLPGSLDGTAQAIRDAGRQVLMIPADITDPADLGAAAATVNERWGGVDVLVNAARFIGGGHMDRFLDTPMEMLGKHVQGNLFAPMLLAQRLIPNMIARGGGTIVNFTSGSAYSTPKKPAGEGGWGMCYAVSKGAVHRVAGIIAVELGAQNIRCFNLDPGFTMTERIAQDMKKFGFDMKGAPADVSGAVAVWLATHPEAAALNGQTIIAQKLCHERGLLPDWEGPVPVQSAPAYDPAAAQVQAFEEMLAGKTLPH